MLPPIPETLKPYLGQPIRLFMADRVLLQQVEEVLSIMRFGQVSKATVHPRYFQAMQQLYNELLKHGGLILVNHPLKTAKAAGGLSYPDLALTDFYGGVASLAAKAGRDPLEMLSRCVPVFVYAQDSDIRLRAVQDLYQFGVMGVFMLRVQPLDSHYEERLAERAQELTEYLLEFYQHRDHKLAELKEYKSAEELRLRRAQAEDLMDQVQTLKQAGNFDKAIELCREAIKILPTDPEAYLEGGRLLVKKRRYPPALQMFRDAEEVSKASPAPNQEIAQVRIMQVRELAKLAAEGGEPLDASLVEGYLQEAAENFAAAVAKAESLVTVNPLERAEARKKAVAAVAEVILEQDLAATLGAEHPAVQKMMGLAQGALEDKVKGGGELDPRYLIQFGLLAYHQGDLAGAMRQWLKAAAVPEVKEQACLKLNHLGTQLRRLGRLDQAVEIYRRLLTLNPSFRGVVLFNLAVAMTSQALVAPPRRRAELEASAAATAVQALYVDPYLPGDPNFYANRVVEPLLKRAAGLLTLAALASPAAADPTAQACREACRRLEAMLAQGQEREALAHLLELTGSLKPFFLQFDRHASQPVAAFARRLHPILAKHPQPRMQVFGKVIGVLIARSQGNGGQAPEHLGAAMEALEAGQQAEAAKSLTAALFTHPELARDPAAWRDENLGNLAREINAKLKQVDLTRFQEH
ncbi:MAG: hypothetical protein ACOZHQ_09630 [Thermodesulfobacteriota bacterium]